MNELERRCVREVVEKDFLLVGRISLGDVVRGANQRRITERADQRLTRRIIELGGRIKRLDLRRERAESCHELRKSTPPE